MTANDAETLLVRPRETSDGSLPSGNSVQLMNLVRIARITGDPFFDKAANDLLRTSADEVDVIPSASAHLMSALDFLIGPSFEIVLAGNDVHPLQRAVFASFVPNKVVLRSGADIARIAPFTKVQKADRRKGDRVRLHESSMQIADERSGEGGGDAGGAVLRLVPHRSVVTRRRGDAENTIFLRASASPRESLS